MKTNAELDHLSAQISRSTVEPARKLLRSIELDTLREAREIVEEIAENTVDDYAVALEKLDKRIRESELR